MDARRLDPRAMLETFRSVVHFQEIETDPVTRRLRRCATVEDLRRVARRRLPRGVFDYIDGGAEDERTLDRNSSDFSSLRFRPRVLRDVSSIET
ncbi:MAG: alpha-hydroxy-acid oxidizing protein, partial [Ilumatobacteraceae bacterium]